MKKLIIIVVSIISILFSCKKEETEVLKEYAFLQSEGFFICNEGTFTFGNASLDFYNTLTGNIESNVFEKANGKKLGDVLQSAKIIANELYLVVNNSGKIVVVDPSTAKVKKEINGFTSPRYILPISDNQAWVSDLYEGQIHIVNLQSKVITGKIYTGTWTEEMINVNGKIYISTPKSSYILIANPNTQLIEDSIKVPFGPNSMELDAEGRLWVLCNGNSDEGIPPALVKINTEKNELEWSGELPMNSQPIHLTINEEKNQLFFIAKDVYTMSTALQSLPTEALIKKENHNFYNLQYFNNQLVLSDAKDYISNGDMLTYQTDGVFVKSTTAGIIPSYIVSY